MAFVMSDEKTGGEVVEATPIILQRIQREISGLRGDTNQRFEAMDKRFEAMDQRLESIEATLKAGFENIGRWTEAIVKQVHSEFERSVGGELHELRGRVTAVENTVFRSARKKPKKH
jgi:hypothetical protein